MICFLSFTPPSNIPASTTTQKKATASAPAPAPPAGKEEEGWFTFIIAYKHTHICLQTETVNKCYFFTDDKFGEEVEEEEVENKRKYGN